MPVCNRVFVDGSLNYSIASIFGTISLGLTIASLYLEHVLYENVRNYYYEQILNNDGDKFGGLHRSSWSLFTAHLYPELGLTYTFGGKFISFNVYSIALKGFYAKK